MNDNEARSYAAGTRRHPAPLQLGAPIYPAGPPNGYQSLL